ncbi:MAG: hypothetical protein RR312_08660 [Bacteroidales bacterium]
MYLQINELLGNAQVVQAVIIRAKERGLDEIYWMKHFGFKQTMSRTFKTYFGTQMGVTAGSIIDKNANKPLRDRSGLGSGVLEVIQFGDRYQIDNNRLDELQALINIFNNAKVEDQGKVMTDIIDYLVDDFRQCILAPHKAMDIIVDSLRSKGAISESDITQGVGLEAFSLPANLISPATSDKANFLTYLRGKMEELKVKYGKYALMEMSRSTFNKNIIGCSEFGTTYKSILGSKEEFTLTSGLITQEMASQVLQGVGLPAIRINEDLVQMSDGSFKQIFADNRISLFQKDRQGDMRWYQTYEPTDPVPTKVYTRQDGGMYIATQRTDEGRFTEYMAEWVPEFKSPNNITIFNLDTMNA